MAREDGAQRFFDRADARGMRIPTTAATLDPAPVLTAIEPSLAAVG
jgi:hypothetical protein